MERPAFGRAGGRAAGARAGAGGRRGLVALGGAGLAAGLAADGRAAAGGGAARAAEERAGAGGGAGAAGARGALVERLGGAGPGAPGGGASLYSADVETAELVGELVGAFDPGGAGAESLRVGEGTWEVFYAPHIRSLSRWLFGTEFAPLRYRLWKDDGGVYRLTSHARYHGPILGDGWLSASGTIRVGEQDSELLLHFDQFWVDGPGESPRAELPGGGGSAQDQSVSALGRLGFVPPLARFPVRYLDPDLSVFRFPPLRSDIAIRRVAA